MCSRYFLNATSNLEGIQKKYTMENLIERRYNPTSSQTQWDHGKTCEISEYLRNQSKIL